MEIIGVLLTGEDRPTGRFPLEYGNRMEEAAVEIAVGAGGRLLRPPARDARKSPVVGYFAIASCKKRVILWVIAP